MSQNSKGSGHGVPRDFLYDLNRQKILESLSMAVLYCYDNFVSGDFAEFGTYKGFTCTVLAGAMAAHQDRDAHKRKLKGEAPATRRRLHLFDSFKGMPTSTHEVDQRSPYVEDGLWSEGKLEGLSPSQLLKKVEQYVPRSEVTIYEGFFNQTLGLIDSKAQFALVHVDCDLYQSAVEVLDHLFSNRMVSEGAVFLFDDWDCNRARRDAGERRAWSETAKKYRIEHSDMRYYGSAGAKLIVHDYEGMT